MRISVVAAVILLTGLAAGCAGAGHGSTTSGPGSGTPADAGPSGPAFTGTTPVSTPPGAISSICGPPEAPGRLIHLHATDGVALRAVTTGSGARGVVLIPELGRAGMCGWWDYATHLAQAGYRVVLFDHRCTGGSSCPRGTGAPNLMSDIRGATAWLRRTGVRAVVLVGGSQGASEAVIAATRPPPDVTGLVALSADELTLPLAAPPYRTTTLGAAPGEHLPVLLAVASGDPNVSVGDTRRLFARIGAADKHLAVLPAGSGHGWDLVSITPPGQPRPVMRQAVDEFIARFTS